jgi:hypothetical protein
MPGADLRQRVVTHRLGLLRPHNPILHDGCRHRRAHSQHQTSPRRHDRHRIFAITCPYRRNSEWRWLRDTDPKAWADAVAFDRAIRSGNVARAGDQQLLGDAFLHQSLVPLDEVDLSTPQERGQGVLFDDQTVDECGLACPGAGVPAGFVEIGARS